ncbi:hypothetical protein AAV35_014050 (plasmid) [Salimicrobium jeotgali]|nr:hypothetical protein [Salimicrobium jeotgali]AKN01842.1 hypothetical protein AAV35_014050 [Salimicrobium jeotgali]MBM7697596.1 hypothetical protein [Salimicrobium jeotgali]
MSKRRAVKKRKMHNKKSKKGNKKIKKFNKQKKQKHISSPNDMVSNANLYEIQNPFQDFTQEERNELLLKSSKNSEQTFEESLKELKELLLPLDTTSLISVFSMYYLSTPEGVHIPDDEHEIYQHHIELLQALSLQIPLTEKKEFKPVLPEDIEKITEVIKKISVSFTSMRMKNLIGKTDEESKKLLLLENMRAHTLAVRNIAYPSQIIETMHQIFSPIEKDFYQNTSLKIGSLIKMILNIIELITQKMNEHIAKVRNVYSSIDKTQMIDSYLKEFSTIENTREELLAFSSNFSKEDLFAMMISHSDTFVRDVYTLSVDDFVNNYPDPDVDLSSLNEILESWSYDVGDLRDSKTEHFLLANPTWRKPLIKERENHYSFPIPSMFFEYGIKIIEQAVENYPETLKKYHNSRGKVLEDRLELLFKSAFPEANIYKGSLWWDEEENKEFENDLLVLVDSYAIVIEAKAGTISDSARRGAPQRLQREVKELLVDPSTQAKRFSNHLHLNKGATIELNTKGTSKNKINLDETEKIITLGVTIELFGSLGNKQKELVEAGFIDDVQLISPSIPINDLEIIFDALETSSEKLHYISKREYIEKDVNYSGDELDLLSFYMQTGFNIDGNQIGSNFLQLTSNSEELDPYYMEKYALETVSNPNQKKPKPRRTTWWNDIIKKLDTEKRKKWTIISNTLLELSYEEQKKFERAVHKIKKAARKGRDNNNDNVVVMGTGSKEKKSILVGIAFKGLSEEERKDVIESTMADILYEMGYSQASFIGFDIDNDVHPYGTLGLASI